MSESELLRAGLQALGARSGLQIVAELAAPNGVDAAARAAQAQLVLAAPVSSGCEAFYDALHRLPHACPALVMLAVPGFRIRANVLSRRYGLSSLPLDVDPSALRAALLGLAGEGREPTLGLEELCVGPGGVLSAREQEVLHELAQGLANTQIAERLYVSNDTVKTHLRRIYRKLDVSSRSEAVALYVGELGTP